MRKIMTLFERDTETRLVVPRVSAGAEWVINGEGVATRKYDGSACLVLDGEIWKRYDAKRGRTPPPDFMPAQLEPDPVSGHWPGWVPVTAADYWHQEAWARLAGTAGNGTYELCGPKVNGNPEGFGEHVLVPHASAEMLEDAPRDFLGLRAYLVGRNTADASVEGIVWHHTDGRMVKIKTKDFGVTRLPRVVRGVPRLG
jgi:hypothetical protein